MIYTDLTKKAMKLAYLAHDGQEDKNGIPYIFHPMHLAEQMTDEETTVCALLHDVVEDTSITFDDLRAQGFPVPVIEALSLLTHDKSVPYMDYVQTLRKNKIAAAVKAADLRHNSDLSRLDSVGDKDMARMRKYQQALALLEEDAK